MSNDEYKVMSAIAASIKPPKPLVIEENMATKWKQWWRQFKWYSVATELENKPPPIQAATFLSCIGEECVRVLDTFGLTDAQEADIKVLKDKFEGYFVPKSCITYERYVFGKIVQSEGEQCDGFFTRVREQAKRCAFSVLHDSMVKDRIIAGTIHTKLLPQLLNDDNDLQKTIDIVRNHEQSVKQTKVMLEKSAMEVDVVRQKKLENNAQSETPFPCNRCGLEHRRKMCPAFNKNCLKCGKKGHFASRCFGGGASGGCAVAASGSGAAGGGAASGGSAIKRANSRYVKALEVAEEEDEELSVEELYIAALDDDDENSDEVWYETVSINGKNVTLKLDSGAACNVLPWHIFCNLGKELQQSDTKRLISYTNHKVSVKGEAKLPVVVRGRKESATFKVVEGDMMPILGRKTSVRFKLITRLDEVSMEGSLFNGLGCIKGFVYDIDLVDNPTFRNDLPRRIPHALRTAVKTELDSMLQMGVIEPIAEPTPVLNAMVIVRQKGKLRICIDPSQVNKNLLRRVHPLSTVEEISARICGSKHFSILDMKKGFWQIPVSERTKKYLAFGTPWGRYTCRRLPFGLASAPEVFQNLMSSLLEGIDGVESSMDDILIHAATEEKLNEITKLVLKRIEDSGLKLNKDKCIFNQPTVKFLGHLVADTGLKADPEKLEAIQKLKRPTNKLQLQRVLGTITYLGKFVENLSAITEPLRRLILKDTEWIWEHEQEEAFMKIKRIMMTPPVLAYYDVNANVTLSVDASSKAFGAVLLQNGKPVAYASKSLTKAQENYPQIEKEAAAIRFACNRFHDYIYGKNIKIETDHKPLESIFKKSLDRAPPRLKRILLDVLQYAPEIIYKKGTDIPLPDILSRDVDNVKTIEPHDELEVHIVLPMSKPARQEIVAECSRDPEIVKLTQVIMDGWPNERKLLPDNLRKYWSFRDEMAVYEGLVFRSHQILIPSGLKNKMLKEIHKGHTGIQGCTRRAKQSLFWLGMTSDIARMVEQCTVCEKHQRSNVKHELMTSEIPTLPFEIVASDMFHFHGKDYLLIADSYSGYFDFEELKEPTARVVIEKLKRWFATHGIPRVLYTDNGPQYSANEFAIFCQKWSFDHVTSSPHFPRSNGLAERFVQTAKTLLKRCAEDGSDVQLALLLMRNTPRDEELQSPSQRLMNRTLRSTIPASDAVLKPRIISGVAENLERKRLQQKNYADRSTVKPLEYREGQAVMLRNVKSGLWTGGRITEKLEQPRSYTVQLGNGKVIRRNVRDIRAKKTPSEPFNESRYELPTEYNHQDQRVAEPEDNEGPERLEEDQQLIDQASTPATPTIRTRIGRVVRPIRDNEFEYY